MKRTIKRGRYFTLLELFICISILGLLTSFLGWQIKNTLDHHRFRKGIARLAMQLQQLRVMALSFQMDMEVTIFHEGDLFKYRIMTEEPLSLPFFDKESVSILYRTFSLTKDGEKVESLKIRISSCGEATPSSLIGFHPPEEESTLWIDCRSSSFQPLEEKPEKKSLRPPQKPRDKE